MSLIQALLHGDSSQVTLDQIRRLVAMVGAETPTIEYKADMTSSIAKAVAALANTYGGLVLVGVTDDRQITGVKENEVAAARRMPAAPAEHTPCGGLMTWVDRSRSGGEMSGHQWADRRIRGGEPLHAR